jgi:membrane-bound lytic murein transglycosylase D
MWQFMPATGRKYLRVGSLLDERKDPLESTRAAARLLKENYQALGNWPLAITAYNHGREGIQRAISQVGSRDLMEIIRRYEGRTFGYASKNFYAEFLAAVEVAKKSDEFFPGVEYHPPFPLGEIEIERAISLETLLRRADISRAEFFDWNPALKPRTHSIPAGYRVKVPTEKLEPVQSAYLQAIGKPPAVRHTASLGESAISWIRHRVTRGQTLSQIARIYQVSVRELQRLNELADIHSITAGDYLRIPQR